MQHGVIQPDGRLYVDNSILATEAVCQTHASLRYGLGYDAPGVRVKMNVGTAVHAGMDVFFAGGAPDAVLAAFEAAYSNGHRAGDRGDGRKAAEIVPGVHAREPARHHGEYCVRNAHLPFEVDVSTIEQGFMVLLDPEFNIWYTGTPDVGKAVMRAAAACMSSTRSRPGRTLRPSISAGTGRPAR